MKAVHTIWRPAVAVLAVAELVGTAAFAARQNPTTMTDISTKADGPGAVISAVAAGANYSTGFEPGPYAPGVYPSVGFAPGYIKNQPAGCVNPPDCWGVTGAGDASLVEGHVDTVHPFGGSTQHLRLSHDPATRTNRPNFGLGVDARIPPGSPPAQPVAPNTVSAEVAITNTFGMDFRFQPQSNSQGFLATSTLFFYYGGIYILDDRCGTLPLSFIAPDFGNWDSSGAYQNMTVAMDPCNNTIDYYYGTDGTGAPILIYSSCVYAGSNLEQFLVFGDNYPGSSMDVDDVVMASGEPCPEVCGDGVVGPTETCEPGVLDCGAGHTCDLTTCQCSRNCTLNEPCMLANGANTITGPCDASFGCIFLYEAGGTVPAVSVELCGSTGFDTNIFWFGSWNDPNDPGTGNDDCCDPADPNCGSFGNGSDPGASCYNMVGAPNYESCVCYAIPDPTDTLYGLQTNTPGPGDVMIVTVNKKAVCAGPHIGSCCDTNTRDGDPVGCVENVLPEDCTRPYDVWSGTAKCDTCVCIPNCVGVVCGDDGCGGNCPDLCSDGLACNGLETCNFTTEACAAGTPIVCNDSIACTVDTCVDPYGWCTNVPNHQACSNNDVCDGIEQCHPSRGCVPGAPLLCDNGEFCDGVEFCDPITGCQDGPDPCEPGAEVCDEVKDQCEPEVIPTVSEWGLVVLALMLLIGAKMYFGRRSTATV